MDLIPDKYLLLFRIRIFFSKKASPIVSTQGLIKPDLPLALGLWGKTFDLRGQFHAQFGLLISRVTDALSGLFAQSTEDETHRVPVCKTGDICVGQEASLSLVKLL